MESSLITYLVGCFLILLGTCLSADAQSDRPVLKVAVYDSAPFGFLNPDQSYGGLMVEIWEEIANEMNWEYEYTLTDMPTLLNGINDQKFDVGLGAISITPKRENLVDFSQPVNPSGTGIAVSKSAAGSSFEVYWKPITISLLKLIGSLIAVLFLSGTIVWLIESKQEPTGSERQIRNFNDGLWWSAVTMTTVGYGDKVPSSRFGKAMGIVWIFASIILLSLFTANASAILTTAKIDSHIQSADDLRGVRVGAAHQSSGEEFLNREHIAHTSYDNIELAIQAMLMEEIDAVVSNVPVLKYLNHGKYYDQLSISQQYLLKNNMGIALQDGSPIREAIDLSLLKIISEPQWQEAVYRYFGEE
ncbi:MAG: transporter substrate-binding domain-containing protein [Bacteroidota bacterium]